MISFSNNKKWTIGMVHAGALPGTPQNKSTVKELVNKAINEASVLAEEGFDAILIENMHDRPYLNRNVGEEIIASMAVICKNVKETVDIPVGVQILAGANKAALAVAHAAGLNFIRAEGFVFGHLADEGWMSSDAGELLRYRKTIGAENIQIFTDVKKKHSSHAATSDVSLEETVKTAEFFLSDGVIITGKSTGDPVNLEELQAIAEISSLPILIGSGVNQNNIELYWQYADAFIIGSFLKKEGKWENDLERSRIRDFMKKVNYLKKI